MKSNILDVFVKSICIYYNFFSRNCSKYLLEILILFLLLTFLFSSYMVFSNYDNLFFRKVFYFHFQSELISDVRYLKEKKTFKENLDLLVKDFLLGNSKGFSLQFGTGNIKLLYSFMSNDVYFINLSKEFYDSFENGVYNDSDKLKVSVFVKSLKDTLNFNYPRKVTNVVVFIEGYILNV
ncbi:hypothetical protein [Borrelia persica]|uniref:hypothetical protein n=1 Tax=Borrelia persica TaxID=44448 RepID=UPI000465DA3C|nr:hypothetical protein [Borrelia persica]